jgi:hypothetical protein
MEPTELLGTAAQVAITLAGFAGVVVVFGSAAVHEWSPVDKFRLRLMLQSASFALALSMIALVLIASDLSRPLVWQLASGLVAVTLLSGLMGTMTTFRRFSPDELSRTGASKGVFYVTGATGFALVGLQVVNAALLAQFWLLYLAIVLSILVALLQFVRLIFSRRG